MMKKNPLRTSKINQRTQFVGDNEWIFDTMTMYNYEDNTMIVRVWNIVNRLCSPSEKRIFEYKYDSDMNENMTNKQIAELMVCSEETIRVTLHKIKQTIIEECKKPIKNL
jgi:hypothetical protein